MIAIDRGDRQPARRTQPARRHPRHADRPGDLRDGRRRPRTRPARSEIAFSIWRHLCAEEAPRRHLIDMITRQIDAEHAPAGGPSPKTVIGDAQSAEHRRLRRQPTMRRLFWLNSWTWSRRADARRAVGALPDSPPGRRRHIPDRDQKPADRLVLDHCRGSRSRRPGRPVARPAARQRFRVDQPAGGRRENPLCAPRPGHAQRIGHRRRDPAACARFHARNRAGQRRPPDQSTRPPAARSRPPTSTWMNSPTLPTTRRSIPRPYRSFPKAAD